ncbi:hypothetical protein HDU76_009135 [Blyttiomyces sp. JEL0837]|nr:hypothetical protein HDU76_009135 [Blyttiomyces sp. JEL0837]
MELPTEVGPVQPIHTSPSDGTNTNTKSSSSPSQYETPILAGGIIAATLVIVGGVIGYVYIKPQYDTKRAEGANGIDKSNSNGKPHDINQSRPRNFSLSSFKERQFQRFDRNNDSRSRIPPKENEVTTSIPTPQNPHSTSQPTPSPQVPLRLPMPLIGSRLSVYTNVTDDNKSIYTETNQPYARLSQIELQVLNNPSYRVMDYIQSLGGLHNRNQNQESKGDGNNADDAPTAIQNSIERAKPVPPARTVIPPLVVVNDPGVGFDIDGDMDGGLVQRSDSFVAEQ